MTIRCNKCSKSVSSEVPGNIIVRAWVECPECVEKDSALSLHTENIIARLEKAKQHRLDIQALLLLKLGDVYQSQFDIQEAKIEQLNFDISIVKENMNTQREEPQPLSPSKEESQT